MNAILLNDDSAMSDLDRYDYEVPADLIAQQPLSRRGDSRLLVVDRAGESIDHAHARDLPGLLRAGDCLVLNDTRVLPARLVGFRERTGGRWQGLFLESDESGVWRILCKTRGKLGPGDTVRLRDRDARDDVRLHILARLDGGHWAVRPETDETPAELLERVGRVPLPPYIRGGEMVDSDREDYQTVYARQPGSVAAPTAGLHFTEQLLREIVEAGIRVCRVTLHVGIGTFRPITVDRLEDHEMHSEWARIDAPTVERINEARSAGGRVVAVGTTSMRTLETAGGSGTLEPFDGTTDLFIRPPFTFHACDGLLTNFHYPRSTLLVLVHTFGGEALMRRAYEEAIAQRYRLFSYGDAMLIL